MDAVLLLVRLSLILLVFFCEENPGEFPLPGVRMPPKQQQGVRTTPLVVPGYP